MYKKNCSSYAFYRGLFLDGCIDCFFKRLNRFFFLIVLFRLVLPSKTIFRTFTTLLKKKRTFTSKKIHQGESKISNRNVTVCSTFDGRVLCFSKTEYSNTHEIKTLTKKGHIPVIRFISQGVIHSS